MGSNGLLAHVHGSLSPLQSQRRMIHGSAYILAEGPEQAFRRRRLVMAKNVTQGGARFLEAVLDRSPA
jgi:hypothetical protein